MDATEQLTIQINGLKDIITKIKAILEWQKLSIFEKNLNPSSQFFFQEDTFQQFIDKQAAFQSLWMKTTILLHDTAISLSQNQRLQYFKELNKLYLQFHYLGSGVKVY
jgi:hypothetical protein